MNRNFSPDSWLNKNKKDNQLSKRKIKKRISSRKCLMIMSNRKERMTERNFKRKKMMCVLSKLILKCQTNKKKIDRGSLRRDSLECKTSVKEWLKMQLKSKKSRVSKRKIKLDNWREKENWLKYLKNKSNTSKVKRLKIK